jgi:hypothetical protein
MNNRAERLIFFLVVWLTMFSSIYVCGQNFFRKGLKVDYLDLKYPGDSLGRVYERLSPKQAENRESLQIFDVQSPANISEYIKVNPFRGFSWSAQGNYVQPPNLYYLQSGLFCKGEWELEKATHIPFRFRLGSLADCNAMEGKH